MYTSIYLLWLSPWNKLKNTPKKDYQFGIASSNILLDTQTFLKQFVLFS